MESSVTNPWRALARPALAALLLLPPAGARADAMLQLFNQTWNQVAQKMPELAEAGYTSLWLPPPNKGAGGGFSVGYDLFDPFDLGDKNQRGTIATQYGTKADLQRLVAVAHRFGLRVYFDTIMNHRAYEVPGYDANTPTNLYPGLVPGDFHLRVNAQGLYRNWPNVSDWGSVFQVQNRPLLGLLDLAHETPNANFGATEGSTASKPSLVRHPGNPEYYDVNSAGVRVGFGRVTPADLAANPNTFREDVGAYLLRSVRYLIDQTRCDGLRLDAVKHVPSYFFGQQSGANRDESGVGYLGAAQEQFNLTHGFTDSNHRNSNFDTELTRNDALLFGEHLGEPPGFNEYLDAGMRLLDNPLRSYLNDVLGNPGRSLAGLEQRDFGGFSAAVRVMHAQSHDNDFANRRELQNAYYFFREGIPLIYSDGYNESPGSGGAAFPRHANAPYLGQFGDRKMPDLAYLHQQLARGGTRSRWGDSDTCAFERFDYREPGSAADQTVVLFAMNDNFGNLGDVSFDDGVTQSDADMPSTCYPVVNSRGVGLVVGFPPGSRLRQLADSPGDERACPEVLVRLATSSRTEAETSKNDSNPVNRRVYVGAQALAAGGGAIECKIPSGSYVAYAYQWPEASRVDTTLTNASGTVAGTDAIVIQQNGRVVPHTLIYRSDGPDGDAGFNPRYPFKMRGSVDASGAVVAGNNVSNRTYAISVPVVTNSAPLDFLVRVDASAVNVLLRLDGGIDLNSHLGLGESNALPGGVIDTRENRPGSATDVVLGYEDTRFQFRRGPEKFAARATSRNTVLSLGAETYSYAVGSEVATNVANGSGFGANFTEETCAWAHHDPGATSTVPLVNFFSAWRYEASGTNLGTAWRAPGYDDSTWPTGPGLLGFENAPLPRPITTPLMIDGPLGWRVTNFYFRTHFNFPSNAGAVVALTGFGVIDDGAVFYLNGTEVHRYNMPAGTIAVTNFASTSLDVTNIFTFALPTNALLPGDNVLAVEVHQASVASGDIVFGLALQARLRQRSSTVASVPVEVWAQAGYEFQINRGAAYYTTDGTNPEGAHGVGQGTTQVTPLRFAGEDDGDDTIDWWRATLPAQPPGTTVKYKVAFWDHSANTVIDYADGKHYGLTQFAVTNWNPATAQVWLHNNLNTNHLATGLAEGFHILRARAFLPRSGKSSVYNTFLQTFYYDTRPPDGAIAFPSANGQTLASPDYDFVVRADESAVEIEYNIIDTDPNNDDATTGFANGNGLTNGVPAFARASPVTPSASLNTTYPDFPQEFRFTYLAVPAGGSATVTVRIKEFTSASFPTQVRTLTRTVNCAAPAQTLTWAFPASNGQVLTLGQSNSYELVACFSDTLTANANLFTLLIDGAEQDRTNAQGQATYRLQGSYCGAGRRDFRYTWGGMTAGQHYLQLLYVGDGVALQASRLVRVNLTGVTDSDGDGLPDTWETSNGLNPGSSAGADGADGDPDGDWFTNLEEYLAGTDPQDGASLLKVLPLPGGGQRISWASVPGRNYQVFATTNVAGLFTVLSGTITALTPTTTYTNTAPVKAKEFYRVRVAP